METEGKAMTDERHEALLEAAGYYRQGDLTDALELIDVLLSDRPDWPEALLLRGKVLFELGRKIKAAHTLRRCVELDPANAEAFYTLGLTFRHLRKLDDAEGCLKAALRRNADDDEARFVLANVLFDQEKPVEAITVYQALIARQPGHADAHFNLGRAATEAGQTDLARQAYARFTELAASRPDLAADVAIARACLSQLPDDRRS
jgi:tetratricopeptide (TPR) repeat protein